MRSEQKENRLKNIAQVVPFSIFVNTPPPSPLSPSTSPTPHAVLLGKTRQKRNTEVHIPLTGKRSTPFASPCINTTEKQFFTSERQQFWKGPLASAVSSRPWVMISMSEIFHSLFSFSKSSQIICSKLLVMLYYDYLPFLSQNQDSTDGKFKEFILKSSENMPSLGSRGCVGADTFTRNQGLPTAQTYPPPPIPIFSRRPTPLRRLGGGAWRRGIKSPQLVQRCPGKRNTKQRTHPEKTDTFSNNGYFGKSGYTDGGQLDHSL